MLDPLPDSFVAEIARYVATCEDLFRGNCGIFALALHRRFGGAVVALCGPGANGQPFGAISHAAWRSPSGRLIDGNGFIPEAGLGVLTERGSRNGWAIREISLLPGFEAAIPRQTCCSVSLAQMLAYVDEAMEACGPAESYA